MYISLIFFLTLLIPFIIMPGSIKAGVESPYFLVLRSTLTIAAAAMIIFMGASMSGQGVYGQMLDLAKTISEDPDITQLYTTSMKAIPISIMFTGAVTSYFAYIILSKLLGKNHPVKKLPKFREFAIPRGAGTAIMLMYIVGWIMTEAEAVVGDMLYLNLSLIFDIVFSLLGIAVVLMFFYLKRVPAAVGWIISLIMWSVSLGRMLLIFLGLFDMFFGIRARMNGSDVRR